MKSVSVLWAINHFEHKRQLYEVSIRFVSYKSLW